MSTVRVLLDEAVATLRGIDGDTPRLDAEILLAMAIGVDRTAVIAQHDAPVGADAERAFRVAIERRAAGEPIAYIRGLREFHGIALGVDARTLVPRPETELLVDRAISEVMRRLGAAPAVAHVPLRVLDVGTGSGAIAIALAVTLRARRVPAEALDILATDVSEAALEVARENAVAHAVGDRVRFAAADLVPDDAGGAWDAIAANLPYIASDALATLPAAVRHEPALALDGGPDGLAVIDRLLARLPDLLAPDGVALLEIGADQGERIVARVDERLPGWRCRVQVDLAGLPRIAVIERGA